MLDVNAHASAVSCTQCTLSADLRATLLAVLAAAKSVMMNFNVIVAIRNLGQGRTLNQVLAPTNGSKSQKMIQNLNSLADGLIPQAKR